MQVMLMARPVSEEVVKLALTVQTFDGAPALSIRNRRRSYLYRLGTAKERGGCLVLLLLEELTVAHQRIEEGFALVVLAEELLAADAEAVETATQRQGFESLAVHAGVIYTLGKIEDALIRSVLQSLCHDGIGCRSTHTLDG